jgi:hypothetical protein
MTIDDKSLQDLIAAREAAERAVEGMAEGARKDKAFEMVFQRLLDGRTRLPSAKRRRRAKQTKARTSEPSPSSPAPRSRRASARQHLDELVGDGFFDSRRSLPEIAEELHKRGHIYDQPALSPRMLDMTRDKILRRDKEQAEDGRKMWFYRRAE